MEITPDEKKRLFSKAEREVVFENKSLQVCQDRGQMPNGKTSACNVIIIPKVSVMIPILDDGRIILERQYRHPTNKILYELPAGKCDKNETPEQAAERELQEEVGKKAGELKKICEAYSAPGYSTELLHFFTAKHLTDNKLPHDEFEAIEIHHFSLEETLDMIKNGEIVDCKTILGILYYEKNL